MVRNISISIYYEDYIIIQIQPFKTGVIIIIIIINDKIKIRKRQFQWLGCRGQMEQPLKLKLCRSGGTHEEAESLVCVDESARESPRGAYEHHCWC